MISASFTLLEHALEVTDDDEEKDKRLQKYNEYCKEHNLGTVEDLDDATYNDILNTIYYDHASRLQKNGEYEKAIDLYQKINKYQDSTKQLIECYKKCGIQYMYMDKCTTLVNAGKKGDNYKETNSITKSDNENGCKLGKFIVSDFTEKEENGDRTKFIKTPGDNMKLWFELERDIDDLTGNGKRSIVADTKGWDQTFGEPKMQLIKELILEGEHYWFNISHQTDKPKRSFIRTILWRKKQQLPIPWLNLMRKAHTMSQWII